MTIYSDSNGLEVESLTVINGEDVLGHEYLIYHEDSDLTVHIEFQTDPGSGVGVNGITTESLLAVLIHRTKHLNNELPCKENANAITSMESALMWLELRTQDRTTRNVEGTSEK